MSAQPTREQALDLVTSLLDRKNLELTMVTGNAAIRDITPEGATSYDYDSPAVVVTLLFTKKKVSE